MGLHRMMIMSLLIALATIMHVVEVWIPLPLALPGIKLGLANMVSMFVLLHFSIKEAILVGAGRILLGTLLSGALGGPAFMLSCAGAALSILAMYHTKRNCMPPLSMIGISIIGAAAHNIGQVALAVMIMNSMAVFYYLPYLLLCSIPTGMLTGMAVCKSEIFVKRM